MSKYLPAPTRIFLVKFANWTSATEITANSKYEARRKALRRFPLCDCGCGKPSTVQYTTDVTARLEELRATLRDESISWGELAELQGLAKYIKNDDVELLESAGVPEGERA